jgi:asparagine synthase (glutamine-hydrolysing)
MPNLVGIWNPDLSEPDIRAALDRQLLMVRTSTTAYATHRYADRGCGVGLLDHGILENGPQPAMTEDGRHVLFLDGEILNADELKRQYRSELDGKAPTPAELVLTLITKHGEDIVGQFIGFFAVILYDRDAKRLTIMSDRFAYRPLFYVQRDRAVLFATEMKGICAADPTPRAVDEIGTFELFAYGIHVIDRTWMRGYLRIPPGTILTVDQRGLRSRTYWLYKFDEAAPRLDQTTYVMRFGTLLDRAVERCMKGSRRIGLFLSGGYDSRSVAASIRRHHRPLPAFTFGHAESRDVRFAAMLAERLGFDHYPITDREPYLHRTCRGIVWRTEGLSTFANCTSLRHHATFKEKMDIILLGFLAEFSGSHTWPRLLMARSRTAAIQAIYGRLLGGRLTRVRRLFRPAFYARAVEAINERFRASFERVENDHPMDMADSWQFLYMQPFSGFQTASVDRHLFESRAPHMDADLVRFQLTIPPSARLEQRVYKQVIAYAYPEIRDVPCANSARPINPHFLGEYALMAARYAGRKVVEPLTGLLRATPPLGREFRDLNEDFRAEPQLMADILQPLLRQGIFPEEIFDRAGIEGLIDEHYRKGAAHADLLSLLISWGLAVRYFVAGDVSGIPADLAGGDAGEKKGMRS